MNYDILANKDSVQKTISALKARGHLPEFVETRGEALMRIKGLIYAGATVMNGSSRTLEEIGFVEYLKSGEYDFVNLHGKIVAEKDSVEQSKLRKQALLADFYLGSAHALAETGEIVVASNSGSQLPHLAYSSENIILVVGSQKIVPTLDDAVARVKEYVLPLEDRRMKDAGMGGSYISKLLIISKEQPYMGRKSRIILVNEKLGF